MLELINKNVKKDRHYFNYSLYRCHCGVEKIIKNYSVTSGNTKSCGCYRDQKLRTKGKNRKHGMCMTPAHRSWLAMRQRCNNPNATGHKNYSDRGIIICPKWDSFEQFYKDMGDRPIGHSLDRIDNDGNYEKSNCKWSTPKEQYYNRRKTKKDGEAK